MKKILLMGDSITDFDRKRDCEALGQDKCWLGYGAGYANRLTGDILYKYPDKYHVINLGIGGNKVTDMYDRIKTDCIDLKPDYLTILVGVNDGWHGYENEKDDVLEMYERVYTKYIEQVKAELPEIKIYIIEPFILESEITIKNPEKIERVKKLAKAAGRIAGKFELPFIELQKKFDEMSQISEKPTYWAGDGVHPTLQGHKIIAEQIMKTLEKDL
ncbi:MAG: SGNH/GDSL hydrolase family protein [Clostridia bacterium]|nr:SGNH/GDSL hydrolase family protein [Clostridia bacterium]